MPKFYGKIGYAETVDVGHGVWKEQITERPYYGDVNRVSRRLQNGEGINDNISINNEISIVADAFAYQNFHAIRWVEWMGVKWKVSNVTVEAPRLILSIGEVYNEH